MSADPAVHDDLYHPVIRRREPEPTVARGADEPSEPGEEAPEPDA
jgi:hypothetical protein